jgi:aminoglycoside phosphotransferase (APT) family kinase protein
MIERDPVTTAATLTRWLGEVAGVADPAVGGVSIPVSTGWSNETILFEASWGAHGERRERSLVARIAPSGHRVFPDDTFQRQHAVMHALATKSDVPMPPLHWIDRDPVWFGQPFWIMDRVHGDIPSDAPPYASRGWLHDASPEQQAQAWHAGIDAMARVHRVRIDDLDLPKDALPAVDDTLVDHLDHYERFLTWAEDGRTYPLARQALDVLRAERPPAPAEGPALVWGDARLSNLVFRDYDVVAVLDWEMCGIGDPLEDLGYWLFADWALTRGSNCERLPGFPSQEETAVRWSVATGRSADALSYYELFGALRFTVIMLRMGKLLEDIGFVPASFAEDNLISRGLSELLRSTGKL